MLNIERVTDCKVKIEDSGNGNPVVVAWQQGARKLKIISGSMSVELTKAQLQHLAEVSPQIIADLDRTPDKE